MFLTLTMKNANGIRNINECRWEADDANGINADVKTKRNSKLFSLLKFLESSTDELSARAQVTPITIIEANLTVLVVNEEIPNRPRALLKP